MDVNAILAGLRIVWQPIVDLETGEILGHEALVRGAPASEWEFPAALFPGMAGLGAQAALETRCRELAFRGAEALPPSSMLFLNVNTRELTDETFPKPPPSLGSVRIALEISEEHPLLSNEPLLAAIQRWRAQGHLIVLDDYGAGYAAAATVLALQPHLLKLDLRLVRGIDQNPQQQSMVASIRDYTADLGIQLVAEGIETAEECAMIATLGVRYGQGYWLGRPEPTPMVQAQRRPITRVSVSAPPHSDSDAESTLQFYAQAIQSVSAPMYVVDRRRRIVGWNDAARRLTGHTDAVLFHHCFEGILDHQTDTGRVLCRGACPMVHSMATSQGVGPSPVTLRARDGSRIRVETVVVPILDGQRNRVVGALEYIHARPSEDTQLLGAVLKAVDG